MRTLFKAVILSVGFGILATSCEKEEFKPQAKRGIEKTKDKKNDTSHNTGSGTATGDD